MSQNPAFHEVLAVALELATAQTAVVKGMSPAQVRSYTETANALSVEMKSGAASNRPGVFAEVGKLFGITESDTRAFVLRLQGSVKKFVASFPELASMDERTRLDTLVDAINRDPAVVRAVKGLASSSAPAAGGPSQQECLAVCMALFLLFLAAALALALYVMVYVCAPLVAAPPLFALCIAGTIAFSAGVIAIAFYLNGLCRADCLEAGPGR